jgi:hypothetical protein
VPSHRVHRLCGALVGLPEDIVAFVDELIDSGRCGAHDVARALYAIRVAPASALLRCFALPLVELL